MNERIKKKIKDFISGSGASLEKWQQKEEDVTRRHGKKEKNEECNTWWCLCRLQHVVASWLFYDAWWTRKKQEPQYFLVRKNIALNPHVSVWPPAGWEKLIGNLLTAPIIPSSPMYVYMPIYVPHIWCSARFNLLWFDINIFIYFISVSPLCIQLVAIALIRVVANWLPVERGWLLGLTWQAE